jgi:hypothetical protein
MKLFLCLFIFPIVLFAQDIPKGATKIIINNELSAKDNFDLVIKNLLDNDYFIATKDSETFTIKTEPKKPVKGHGLYYMNIRSIDKEVHISGMWKSGIELSLNGVNSTDSYEPIIKRGGAYIPIFDNMDNFATSLKGIKSYK